MYKEAFSERNENNFALNIFFSEIVRLLSEIIDVSYGVSFPFRIVKQKLESDEINSVGLNGQMLFDGLMQIYYGIIQDEKDYPKVKADLEELLKNSGFTNYTKSFINGTETEAKRSLDMPTVNGLPIEINTIAGIKGETHTATLVLETFFYEHNIKSAISAMLVGSAKEKSNERIQKRVKHLYVAMTRPTDFLCLALSKHEYKELCKIPTIKSWFEVMFSLVDISNDETSTKEELNTYGMAV